MTAMGNLQHFQEDFPPIFVGEMTGILRSGLCAEVHKGQVEIHAALNAGNGALGGVLPQVEVVEEGGDGLVLCQPEGILSQTAQVVVEVGQIQIEVKGRGIAGLFDLVAEGEGTPGEGLGGQTGGAGIGVGDDLPVKDHWKVML